MSEITGQGFSRQELSEDERAQLREMFREFEAERPVARPFWSALRSLKSLALTAGILAVLGGIIRYLVNTGLVP